MPASYMDSSESGNDEEEHFANDAQACDQMEFVGPFARTVVQSAKLEQLDDPKRTTFVYLRYAFQTKGVRRSLSNFSGRWLRQTSIVNRLCRPNYHSFTASLCSV